MAGKGAMNFGKSKARMMGKDKNKITFKDVAGVDEAKDEAIDFVHQIHGGGLFSGRGGETMVIAFSDHATVVSPLWVGGSTW